MDPGLLRAKSEDWKTHIKIGPSNGGTLNKRIAGKTSLPQSEKKGSVSFWFSLKVQDLV